MLLQRCKGELWGELEGGRPLALEVKAAWSLQVCEALHAIHEQDVIHRDISPWNVFVDHDDQLKIGDFGLAVKVRHAIRSAPELAR
jgi:serine/threonine protein kinase